MKGLDNWIMGLNDPSAPFNQTDLDDKYPHVLEKCEWLTDDIYEEHYDALCELMDAVIEDVIAEKLNNEQFHTQNWERERADFLAEQLRLKFEGYLSYKNDKNI